MRLYVTGCGGMLGDAVWKYFTSRGDQVMASDVRLTSPWVRRRDVRSFDVLRNDVESFCPDVIMNLAALTDLEQCERFPEIALQTNTMGSVNCAELALRCGIPYVYISTAGIFDGRKDFYGEEDIPHPLSVYGRSKYFGELIATNVPQHIVLRCGWQMGSGPKDAKFVQKLWRQIRHGAAELNVVQDKCGTPTYVNDFTWQIAKLIETRSYGVFNAVCSGEATRYDVAVEFVRLLGLEHRVKVKVVPSSFWEREYFAPRPASERLSTAKLDQLGLNVMRPWQEALAEYVVEYHDYFTLGRTAATCHAF